MNHNSLYLEIKSICKQDKESVCFTDTNNNTLSKEEFLNKINTIQKNLHLMYGDIFFEKRVVVNIKDTVDFLVTTYALNGLGACVVPNFSEDENFIKSIYEKTNAILYISDKESNLKNFICIEQLQKKNNINSNPTIKITKEAMIIYTSGTTGEPKGVILGNEGIIHITSFMNEYMNVDKSIKEMLVAPLDHAFGFGRAHCVLKVCGTIFVGPQRLDIRLILNSLKNKQINAISIMPSLLTQIITVAGAHFAKVADNLKWLQIGAMKFSLEDRNRLCEIFPNTTICLHFGMSESMRTTFINLHKESTKRHTEGKASFGTKIAIFDENKNILPPNNKGRLATQGKNLALGYVDHELWEKQYHNGWFISNDLAMIDEDGYLHHSGRIDDIINLNGLLIHPDEVEEKLQKIITNATFCVVGMDDPKKQRDRVIALFVEGSNNEQITLEYLSKKWDTNDRHLIPSYIYWVKNFPRTKTGKIIRSSLGELIDV